MAAPLVTLSSDLGWAYAAQMKAVLYRTLPPGSVVDLAHDLPPHAVEVSAFLLREMASRFPPGTIHVGVVDPGVGGRRAPIAAGCRDGSFLVGPDNGLLSPLAERLGVARVVRLVATHSRTGATFDGRDLFAPAAAALARGVELARLGRPTRLTRLVLPEPKRHGQRLVGQVVWVDPFGNLLTNLSSDWLRAKVGAVTVLVAGRRRRVAVVRVYEDLPRGSVGVLPSSFGLLELAVRGSSAALHWNVDVGARVQIASAAAAVPAELRRRPRSARR
ncbi:MAG: SAM-dependent chlorinase/fluorinase [Thermoplasmata archaeon]|nr:SAM-dependent chlorinase/fluorinase [Thermoplasmata archaeon]MCI4341234.1 SAM-dependent chlorinase/fluorinase [Thermoplasmata archaeon]